MILNKKLKIEKSNFRIHYFRILKLENQNKYQQ